MKILLFVRENSSLSNILRLYPLVYLVLLNGLKKCVGIICSQNHAKNEHTFCYSE